MMQRLRIQRPEPTQRELLVEPRSGLCNRLRGLVSGMICAEASDRIMRVYWNQGRLHFYGHLHQLWSNPFGLCQGVDLIGRSDNWAGEDRVAVLRAQGWVGPRPEEGYRPWFERLHPVPAIADRVQATLAKLQGAPRIGFQTRTVKAHPMTAAHSPTAWFVQRARELRARFPEASFFLSADHGNTANAMHEADPRFVVSGPVPTYNSPQGVQKGLTDLYVLRKLDYVVTAYWSSVADVIRETSDVPGENSQDRWGEMPP